MNRTLILFAMLSSLASCSKEEPEFIRQANRQMQEQAIAKTWNAYSQEERKEWINAHRVCPSKPILGRVYTIPQ